LIFPDSLEVCGDYPEDPDTSKSRLCCTECGATLAHEEKPKFLGGGSWIADNPGNASRGFYISGLASPSKYGRPDTLAREYLRAQTNKSVEQELWNSAAGLPYIADGSNVTEDQVLRAITPKRDKSLRPWTVGPITAGIDVGKWLHVEIVGWNCPRVGYDINVNSRANVLWEGRVAEFSDVQRLLTEWQVTLAVIDLMPEPRKTLEFAKKFHGRVIRCEFAGGDNLSPDWANYKLKASRTHWMDAALGRFKSGTITLPRDTGHEYRQQICDPVRRWEDDKDGNPVGKWVKRNTDHFALARTYSEMALPLVASFTTGRAIGSFL
jgi:hypothetical protein